MVTDMKKLTPSRVKSPQKENDTRPTDVTDRIIEEEMTTVFHETTPFYIVLRIRALPTFTQLRKIKGEVRKRRGEGRLREENDALLPDFHGNS